MPYDTSGQLPDPKRQALTSLADAFEGYAWADNYIANHSLRCADDVANVAALQGGANVLNIGGAPYIFEALGATEGLQVTSLDLEPARHAAVIERMALSVQQADFEDAQQRAAIALAEYDVICLCEVFEHMRLDLIGLLTDIRDRMKPGARLYLTTPNHFFARGFLKQVLRRRSGPSLVEEWGKLSQIGHMGHVREYSKVELVELFEQTGFTVESFRTRNRSSKIAKTLLGFVPTLFLRLLEANFDLFGQELIFVLRRD